MKKTTAMLDPIEVNFNTKEIQRKRGNTDHNKVTYEVDSAVD